MDIMQLPTTSLVANDYNFNEMNDAQLKGLAGEVRRRGFLMHHIVARKDGEIYVIIDGEHQWKAAQMAGLETVPVQVLESTEVEAIAETYRRNGLRGETNRLKLARAVQRMQAKNVDAEGKPPSNVKTGKLLGRSDKWVATTLEYARLADLGQGREDFPNEEAIAKLTEERMKEWLAFADGSGPSPNGEPFTLAEGGEGEESESKPKVSDEEKARKAMESVILKVRKMTIEDRVLVAAAIKRFDREDKKAATEKIEAEPSLVV